MIPLANPRANYLAHITEINKAIHGVLNGGEYIGGKEVEAFEEEFAAFIGRPYAIGVNSGTDALIIAMRALGIGSGDVVSTTPGTALATVAAILDVGAGPLLDERRDQTIQVHLYGEARPGRCLIEDCAQACGGFRGKKRLGTLSEIACFSFYPTKNLGAIGDGGMIVTSNTALADACRHIREYGWNSNRVPKRIGINSRLDPIQAAVLRVKLKYLDEDNERRRAIARRYNEGLLTAVNIPEEKNHCFHLYVIECDDRDELKSFLLNCGIQTGIHYDPPIHMLPYYGALVKTDRVDESEDRAKRILSLPMYPELTDAQVNEVIERVQEFYALSQAA